MVRALIIFLVIVLAISVVTLDVPTVHAADPPVTAAESQPSPYYDAEAGHRLLHMGENVAFARTVDQAQDSLMRSPPHRANLLNADYNVAGFSVVRSGSLLYVTQDFGHSLPSYTVHEADDLVAGSVEGMRAQTRLPRLRRRDGREAASGACALAEADSLHTPAPRGRIVLRYTTSQPRMQPANASRAIADRSVRAYAVGSSYARTPSYPTGVYWVALLFY